MGCDGMLGSPRERDAVCRDEAVFPVVAGPTVIPAPPVAVPTRPRGRTPPPPAGTGDPQVLDRRRDRREHDPRRPARTGPRHRRPGRPPVALALGRPLAGGVIEACCRSLIKDRLDITGARWSPTGAEAVLLLRAVLDNGDFDA